VRKGKNRNETKRGGEGEKKINEGLLCCQILSDLIVSPGRDGFRGIYEQIRGARTRVNSGNVNHDVYETGPLPAKHNKTDRIKKGRGRRSSAEIARLIRSVAKRRSFRLHGDR